MKIQPDIYGIDGTKKFAGYVGPIYSCSLASVIQTPDRCRYLYLLIVFPHRPVDTGEPCLFVSSEVTDGGRYVLGVFDDAGHRILQNEEGAWTDVAAFSQRAIEIASELLATCFVRHEHSKWKYKTVSSATPGEPNDLISQGWITINSSVGPDGNKWFLLKKPNPIAA
jgi:hypothetical protein